MGMGYSTRIVTNGLVFYYDMNNLKSNKGSPTTNYFYNQNARTDASYTQYVQTTSGTWPTKHPDAIRVYNFQGNEITGYVNTGVTDYTNTYHAIWTLDPVLRRPVVTMRDVDGQWKAKSWGTGQTMTSMGLGYGSQYTISWLQWTDNIAKSAQAGMYGQNTSGSNGFHDGQSLSKGATAYNTKPYTWQRVYATFTVSSAWNLNAGLSCYMYGHYTTRGTIKICDVQFDPLPYPTPFIEDGASTRSDGIVDLTGNSTITQNNLSFNSDGTFSFNGSSSRLSIPSINFSSGQTIEIWLKPSENDSARRNPYNQAYGGYGTWTHEPSGQINYYYGDAGANASPYIGHTSSFTVNQNEIACVCTTRDTSTSWWYKNGERYNSYGHGYGTLTADSNSILIGGGYAGYYLGDIYAVKLYNRALTAIEVKQNFAALRGRFGL